MELSQDQTIDLQHNFDDILIYEPNHLLTSDNRNTLKRKNTMLVTIDALCCPGSSCRTLLEFSLPSSISRMTRERSVGEKKDIHSGSLHKWSNIKNRVRS